MDSDILTFFLFNFVIVVLLVLILLKKTRQSGAEYRLFRRTSNLPEEPHYFVNPEWQRPAEKEAFYNSTKSSSFGEDTATDTGSKVNTSAAPRRVKQLNVVFNFNGHDFDAYEVLGIPAGSSITSVDEAYAKSLGQFADDSQLIEYAYQAIKRQHSSG